MLTHLGLVMNRDWLRTTVCTGDGQAHGISLVVTIRPGRAPGLPVPLRQRCPGSVPAADRLLHSWNCMAALCYGIYSFNCMQSSHRIKLHAGSSSIRHLACCRLHGSKSSITLLKMLCAPEHNLHQLQPSLWIHRQCPAPIALRLALCWC